MHNKLAQFNGQTNVITDLVPDQDPDAAKSAAAHHSQMEAENKNKM